MIRRPPRFPPCPSTPLSRSEADRQFFKSAVGLPEPWAARRETPLSHSFCQHVVATGAPLRIEDARQDPLVCDNLAVPEDRKSTRLNSSHANISYAVFCLNKK